MASVSGGEFFGEVQALTAGDGLHESQPGDWDYEWNPSDLDRTKVAYARQNLDADPFSSEALDAMDPDQLVSEAERLLYGMMGPGAPGPADALSAMLDPAILMRDATPDRAEKAAQFGALAAAIARRVLKRETEGA